MFGVLTALINLVTGIITGVIGGTFRIVGGCLGSIALAVIVMLVLVVVAMGHVL